MNLAREASAAGAGILSAAGGKLAPQNISPIGGVVITGDAAAEVAALATGLGMQLFAPNTAPSVADGLADGAIALLTRRVAVGLLSGVAVQTGTAPYAGYAERMNGSSYREVASPTYAGALGSGRGASVVATGLPIVRVG